MGRNDRHLEWLKSVVGADRELAGMVVGFGRVLATVKALVEGYNHRHFDPAADRLKVIGAKLVVLAALREMKLMLEKWKGHLYRRGALTAETEALWKTLEPTRRRVDALRDYRNLVFHHLDPVYPPDDLIEVYESVDGYDLDELNRMLRELEQVGVRMQQDALTKLGH